MIAGGIFQPITSQTLLELNWEYIYTPFASREKSCNPKFKRLQEFCPKFSLSLVHHLGFQATLLSLGLLRNGGPLGRR